MKTASANDLASAAWRWGRSRPYHLLPWIALGAAVILWPGRPPPPPPGLSEDRVMDPAHFERAEPRRGRAARWPHQMTVLGWRDILWRTFWEVSRDKLPSVSGGVTFYVLLAIFPAIGAFVSLYGLAADVAAAERQLAEMSTVFPTSVVQIVGEQMLRLAGQHPGKLSAAFLVSLAISVWSANAGMKALFEGLNVTYDEVEKRDFVRRTAITYASTLGALAFLASVAVILVATPVAMRALGFARFDAVWVPLRWAVVFGVTAGGFALIYRYGPSRRLAKWRWVVLGAVLGATAWLGGSLGFSWYVNNVAHFDATYGSLGAVVAFMSWVWFSVMSLLVGAEFNAEIEHQTAVDSTIGPDRPMGLRGAAMADTVGKPFRFRESLKHGAGVARRQTGALLRPIRQRLR
ncbi:MAG: YihY/virulence factor BrkB family protein [Pseudomonadota bacterium]